MSHPLSDSGRHAEPGAAVFADVVLPLYLPQLFTYRIPVHYESQVQKGMRVVVPFGNRKTYSAIIWEVHRRVPQKYEAKYILSVVDDEPLVNEAQLSLWEWMAGYYMCSLGEVMNAALPAGLKLESESKIILRPGMDIDHTSLTDQEYMIVEALELQKELTIKQVSEILELNSVYKLLKSLIAREIIYIQEQLRPSYKPKVKDFIRLHPDAREESKLRMHFDQLEKKAPKQSEMLMAFLHLSGKGKPIERSVLAGANGDASGGQAAITALIKKNILEIYQMEVDRLQYNEEATRHFSLNPQQLEAASHLRTALQEKGIALLHGITGSGKTHIYVKFMQEALDAGKQVLYLIPEIALGSQMIKRLRKYFGGKVMLSHSKFNENERVEIWHKLSSGKISMIMGARSALFLPFKNLGLIIVDEEHEPSYKQQDPAPRYHARDTALMLGKIHGAPVILGSATPSVETYFLAQQGKFGYISLTERFGGAELPEIITADVAYEKKALTLKNHFTSVLLEETEQQLKQNKQVILFQNRRGFVPQMECENCGWVPKCIHCDISLTYHKYNHTLKCHYCGYKEQATEKCGACGSVQLNWKGFGTEKIEEDLKVMLPDARIARLDLETTRTKIGHQQVITDLEERRTDILIGTQMVSKGLDFENVTLVGIMNADQMLHFPDFRAHERSFQMLSQVSGRAGRRLTKGKVVIQTSMPSHPVITFTINHDYVSFFEWEIKQREKFSYPPFSRLIKMTLKSKEEIQVQQAADALGIALKQKLGKRIIGPEKPVISKLHDQYLRHIMVKIERAGLNPSQVKEYILSCIEAVQIKYKKVSIIPDVDPG